MTAAKGSSATSVAIKRRQRQEQSLILPSYLYPNDFKPFI
jgi:hypothetical protein